MVVHIVYAQIWMVARRSESVEEKMQSKRNKLKWYVVVFSVIQSVGRVGKLLLGLTFVLGHQVHRNEMKRNVVVPR